MDYHNLRAVFTVVIFVVFIGIVLWAWSSKRKRDFDEAANLPLDEPEHPRADKHKGGTL